MLILACGTVSGAGECSSERGVASSVPASRWVYGFLTGNGRIGAIVYGNPTRETIVLNFHYDTLTHQAGLVPDRWVHVAATVNGETGQTIPYVDGKPVKRRF